MCCLVFCVFKILNKMNTVKPIYKNLVFEGGGVKGAAYAGSVQVLHDNDLLKNLGAIQYFSWNSSSS